MFLLHARYTLVIVDFSRWPMESVVVDTTLEKAADILHQDERNALLLLYPMPYKSVLPETSLRRVRLVEDQLMKHNLCMNYKFVTCYTVSDEHGNEKRALMQEMRLCVSKAACGSETEAG